MSILWDRIYPQHGCEEQLYFQLCIKTWHLQLLYDSVISINFQKWNIYFYYLWWCLYTKKHSLEQIPLHNLFQEMHLEYMHQIVYNSSEVVKLINHFGWYGSYLHTLFWIIFIRNTVNHSSGIMLLNKGIEQRLIMMCKWVTMNRFYQLICNEIFNTSIPMHFTRVP